MELFTKLQLFAHLVRSLFVDMQLPTTARQYGEVVLPDVSTGQGLVTPRQRGQKAVTVQGGYGVVFAIRVQVLIEDTRVAVQS